MRPLTKGGNPDLPDLKAVTDIADVASFPSRGSTGSEGIEGVNLPSSGPLNTPPIYPADLLARGIGGKGILLVKTDVTGRVTAISIQESSGVRELDQSALEGHRRWIYNPARRAGKAIPFEFFQPFEFKPFRD